MTDNEQPVRLVGHISRGTNSTVSSACHACPASSFSGLILAHDEGEKVRRESKN